MEFKDYYAALGVERTASQDEVKRAYRKLARKFHPDVSKEAHAETRFKEVAEAYEALSDPDKRAAYDEAGRRRASGEDFRPPPGWNGRPGNGGRDTGFSGASHFSEFFDAMFRDPHRAGFGTDDTAGGGDHHARLEIDLEDVYRGARRTIGLRVPKPDAQGQVRMEERQLDVTIPKGVRAGQQLRLNGQGAPGLGGAAGDLYLEISITPHRLFRVDGRDVYLDLPVTPWEAALGGTVTALTPDGSVELNVPKGSASGRKMRLKGKGLPGNPAGDMYVVLKIATPPADSAPAEEAYAALARAFPRFDPRRSPEAA